MPRSNMGWLNVEFRYQAFCSRLPSRYVFYLSRKTSLRLFSFRSFMAVSDGKSRPSGDQKALEV